jgi:hypothetical protein
LFKTPFLSGGSQNTGEPPEGVFKQDDKNGNKRKTDIKRLG